MVIGVGAPSSDAFSSGQIEIVENQDRSFRVPSDRSFLIGVSGSGDCPPFDRGANFRLGALGVRPDAEICPEKVDALFAAM
jgi:hypothetical protein